jgi:tetratricopeptide (TPR) repeat protein
MGWETALDRLVTRQIHLAERGEIAHDDVIAVVRDLHALQPGRAETAFHLGHARALLGADLPEPEPRERAARRWYLFGRLRGHERRGERNWVADLLTDPTAITELLADPRIAGACLPLAMRTLFWSGDLDVAVQAIDYLASVSDSDEARMLVDASLADLLTRLERRDDPEQADGTVAILQKCIRLSCFARLPDALRAGYHVELGTRLLAASEFDEARRQFDAALPIAGNERCQKSRAAVGQALAGMRVHRVDELRPLADRPDRDVALRGVTAGGVGDEGTVPEAQFLLGLFAYERCEWSTAAERFDACIRRFRRIGGRDEASLARTKFLLAAALLAGGSTDETARALRLMDEALGEVKPDLETFYAVHEELKSRDRRLALRFLDAVDVGRGTAPDQLLFVALEYLALGEAQPAAAAAERVLEVAVDLDQRIEALRVVLTSHNMRGDRAGARATYQDIRELLLHRGKFAEIERLLKDEDFVGQALDHVEVKYELVGVYEEMEGREVEKAQLQAAIARSLRSRKDEGSLRDAFAILREVEIGFPELAKDELRAIEKLLELADAPPADLDAGARRCHDLAAALGRRPKVLVVGGNERQRRHHPRFEELAAEWGFEGEWLMANYLSPQRVVSAIADRFQHGVDVLVLLHWNRHETTEPALELARRAAVPARTVHYAGFTSLQVCLLEMLARAQDKGAQAVAVAAAGEGRARGKSKR